MNTVFGLRLQEWQKEQDFTTYAAAAFLGISVVTYRKWCYGEIPYAIEVLARLGQTTNLQEFILGKDTNATANCNCH